MIEIATVTGTTTPDALGRTLMHEHLMIGYPGWESHSTEPGPNHDERFAVCVDKIEEMKAAGFTSMLDPCPNDLGRDVEFIAEVAQKTGFQIICATGLYKQSEGGLPYWHFRGLFGDVTNAMAELFEKELTEGIGSTGIRAGIIKVATGPGEMTAYERQVFNAAAKASGAAGAPVTTHTDEGTVGDVQQQVLTQGGVPAHRIVIGHSCGTSDHDYHMGIARSGSYLGFDRFGLSPSSRTANGCARWRPSSRGGPATASWSPTIRSGAGAELRSRTRPCGRSSPRRTTLSTSRTTSPRSFSRQARAPSRSTRSWSTTRDASSRARSCRRSPSRVRKNDSESPYARGGRAS